jgi:TonB family protein
MVFIGNNIMDKKQLEKIINHEQIHIRQKHSIDIILFEIFAIVQWFNPFIWFYKSTIKNVHEYLADQGVLSKGHDRKDYQNLLLHQTFGFQFNFISNNLNKSLIKRRFNMMSKPKTKKYMLIKMAFILPVAVLISFIFSSAITKQVVAQSDKATVVVKSTSNTQDPQKDPVFTVVEQLPEYPGGEEARIKFIGDNINYPKEAVKNGITGTVYVTFIIEKDGSISNVKVLRGIGGGCDEEAVRVISIMPNWKPGLQGGQPVRVQFNMPIKFDLNDENDKQNKSGTIPPPPPEKWK